MEVVIQEGEQVSVSVDSLSPVTVDCRGSSWSVDLDVSELTDNGSVTITASQTVGSDTSTESIEVDRCVSSEDDSSPKWICNYGELKEMAEQKSKDKVYYILGVDIDARQSWSEGKENCGEYDGSSIHGTDPCSGWEPVDLSGGFFDGRGHTIENLYIHSSDSHVGLFGQSNLRISGLHLKNARVHSTQARSLVGGLIGRNYGNIEDCSLTGVVSGVANGITGGLVGDLQGKIVNSYVNAQVEAEPSEDTIVGGLIGLLRGGEYFIMNSYSKGSVSVNGELGDVGGLVGWLVASSLHRAYSHSRVSGGSLSGGLVGNLVGKREIKIHSSYSLAVGSADDPLFVTGRTATVGSVSDLFWDTQASGSTASKVEGGHGFDHFGDAGFLFQC